MATEINRQLKEEKKVDIPKKEEPKALEVSQKTIATKEFTPL